MALQLKIKLRKLQKNSLINKIEIQTERKQMIRFQL